MFDLKYRSMKLQPREWLLLSLLTMITLALLLSAVGCGSTENPKESASESISSASQPITGGGTVTTPVATTTVVRTDPVTTPVPATTTVPVTTEPPVTTTKPITTEPAPPAQNDDDYLIDMTDYWDVIDPTGDLWDDVYLVLLNAAHPVEKDFENNNLLLKDRVKFSSSDDYNYRNDPDIYLNTVAMKALSAMFNEAAADGIKNLDVTSAYRSYSYQQNLFNKNCNKTHHWLCVADNCGVDWIGKDDNCPVCGKRTSEKLPITQEEKEANVATYSCAPGTSDHQSGLAVDIIQTSLPSRFDSLIQEFGETDAGKWLANNCYRFGFVLRFPEDKEEQTGIIYEPWHFRYVGRTHATAMHELNMCLEEYVDYLNSIGYFD